MKKIKINQLVINDKSIKCEITDDIRRMKIINAILTVDVATQEKNQCSFSYKGYKSETLVNSWNNVDTMDIAENKIVELNISDEVQDSINNN